MLTDLEKQIDAGKSDEAIMAYFVDKYGDDCPGCAARDWIQPGSLDHALCGAGDRRACLPFISYDGSDPAGLAPAARPSEDLTKYQDKVEEELKKFTPED